MNTSLVGSGLKNGKSSAVHPVEVCDLADHSEFRGASHERSVLAHPLETTVECGGTTPLWIAAAHRGSGVRSHETALDRRGTTRRKKKGGSFEPP